MSEAFSHLVNERVIQLWPVPENKTEKANRERTLDIPTPVVEINSGVAVRAADFGGPARVSGIQRVAERIPPVGQFPRHRILQQNRLIAPGTAHRA